MLVWVDLSWSVLVSPNVAVLPVMSGWGLDVFTKPNYYWWMVPVLTSHVGAVLGAWIYYLAIGRKDQSNIFLQLVLNV